ncbi:hypothetical protein BOX15_Mlig012426g4 [Macrostomum lignano]|uniref:BTB domain-containing protein n=1 Tax=Macrostomum lignano TaxID=282301 RepID=A0A267DNT0_9PLAT|nr:hypothetical protein BOX15_Mlig012426g4 [Macrostomum lignano]
MTATYSSVQNVRSQSRTMNVNNRLRDSIANRPSCLSRQLQPRPDPMLFSPSAWLKTPSLPIKLSKDSKKAKQQQQQQQQQLAKATAESNGQPDAPSTPPDSTDPATHAIPCRNVAFALDDDSTLYSNTWVLSLHSPVLEAMFSNRFIESDQAVVKLPGKDQAPMRALLNCLHNLHFCRPISNYISPELAVPVLALIKEYQVQVLWEPAVQLLRNNITKANVVVYFQEVLDYKLDELEYSMLAEMSLLFEKCLRTLETQKAFRELSRPIRERILSALCVYHRVTPPTRSSASPSGSATTPTARAAAGSRTLWWIARNACTTISSAAAAASTASSSATPATRRTP